MRGRDSAKNSLEARIDSYNERDKGSRYAGGEKIVGMMHKPGSEKK